MATSGDLTAPIGVAKVELQMKSDPEVEATNPSEDRSNHAQEIGSEAEELGSSSSREQFHESTFFSPGFRTAAAMAGWDAETLLLAALCQSPIDSDGVPDIPDASQVTSMAMRKRDKRTPLSSARRPHRRLRWEDSNGRPLGRVPMRPLTLLSDNELENGPAVNEKCSFVGGVQGKENCSPQALTCKEANEKGKGKERTPTKAPCLDQLREELSCAVCLDLCFEPSTIPCGHSFCGTCLQSVLKKCGHRCPKCRLPLRSEALRNCRINTILWNTIQILFPIESAARIQDKLDDSAKEAAKRAMMEDLHSRQNLGTRPSRLQPWCSPSANSRNQTSVVGTLGSSFQAASELMLPSSRQRNSAFQQYGPRTGTGTVDRGREERYHSRSRRLTRATQEQVDAALAAQLQQTELNLDSDVLIEDPGGGSRIPGHPTRRRRNRMVALAAVDLHTTAPRVASHHRPRPES